MSKSRIVCITGARDGVGKSTIAANLAVLLSEAGTKRILVMEVDQQHIGDVQVLLGRVQLDADDMNSVKKDHVVDEVFSKSATLWHNVEILYPMQNVEKEQVLIELCDIRRYVIEKKYDYVLIDAGVDSVFAEMIVNISDHVIVVSLSDSMAVLALRKYLKSGLFEACRDRTSVVMNRTEQGFSRKECDEMARLLRVQHVFCIRDDVKQVSKSLSVGKLVSIMFPKVGISRDMAGLAYMIGEKEALPFQSRWKKRNGKKWFEKPGKKREDKASQDNAPQQGTDVDVLQNRVHTRILNELNATSLALIKDNIDIASEKGRELVRTKIFSVLEEEARDLHVHDGEKNKILHDLLDELLGHGPLEVYLRDDTVTEIMVIGCKQIYIERGGKLELVKERFSSESRIRNVIDRIISPLGRRVDESSPMVDARLEDGSRVNIVIPPLSLSGSLITIRKFPKEGFTIEQLIVNGTLTREMADYLHNAVITRKNIIISGGTGSGKTTLLNILAGFVPKTERIVTIEDAAELQLAQEHVCSLEARPANIETKGEVTIRNLVRNALRMRPDRIIVGEVRGGEALDMLQAMNTGHSGSLTTCHANSTKDSLSRLEIMVLMAGMDLPVRAVQSQIASALDIMIQVQRSADGSRRVVEITELKDFCDGQYVLEPVFVESI
jgi:pilus assembly protein CpaF